MHKPYTILARYVDLSRQAVAAEKAGDLVAEEKALDAFWAFVDKYLYDLPLSQVRATDRANSLTFVAFD